MKAEPPFFWNSEGDWHNMNEYIYLRAWCRMLGSFSTFTENEVARAKADGAPQTAIYRRTDGTWATFEEIQCKETKQTVQAIVREMKSTPDSMCKPAAL